MCSNLKSIFSVVASILMLAGCAAPENMHQIDLPPAQSLATAPLSELGTAPKSEHDALAAAEAMNYCQVSLTLIVQSRSRIILQQEYDNILNNLNFNVVQDPETIKQFTAVLNALHEKRLTEAELAYLKTIETSRLEQSQHDVWVKRLKTISNGLSDLRQDANATGGALLFYNGPAATAHVVAAASGIARTIVDLGTGYLDCRENEQEYSNQMQTHRFKSQIDDLKQLHELRLRMFELSFDLQKRWGFPDAWRLTERQLNDFAKALFLPDKSQQARLLANMQADFSAYPPFWFYLGKAYEENGQRTEALAAYANLEKRRVGLLRHDPEYTAMCMRRAAMSDIANIDRVNQDLRNIAQNAPDDAAAAMFVACKYVQLGNTQTALVKLRDNLDRGLSPRFSARLLADLLWTEKRPQEWHSLFEELMMLKDLTPMDMIHIAGTSGEPAALNRIQGHLVQIRLHIGGNRFPSLPRTLWGDTVAWGLVYFPLSYRDAELHVWDLFPDGHSSRLEAEKESQDKGPSNIDGNPVTYELWIRFLQYLRNNGLDKSFELHVSDGMDEMVLDYMATANTVWGSDNDFQLKRVQVGGRWFSYDGKQFSIPLTAPAVSAP